jgi:hypothetical protein
MEDRLIFGIVRVAFGIVPMVACGVINPFLRDVPLLSTIAHGAPSACVALKQLAVFAFAQNSKALCLGAGSGPKVQVSKRIEVSVGIGRHGKERKTKSHQGEEAVHGRAFVRYCFHHIGKEETKEKGPPYGGP